ncbi:MAG: hypothetical protein ABI797_04905 [Chloroflexota bacterium]
MTRVRALAFGGAALALAFGGAAVSATPPTPAGAQAWAANQSVDFRWKEDSVPPAWLRAAVVAAADDSTDSRASRAAVLDQEDGATSWVGYTDDIPTGYAIAYTVSNQPNWFHVLIRPQGTVLDWGTLRWCQFYADPPSGCYDAELITLHEFGHVQGLGHVDEADVTNWTDTIMHAAPKSRAKAGWNAHAFGRCDVARLQIVYRALTPSTAYSSCLALPSELTLSVNATSVESGNSVTFTARLKVADDATYTRLAGQPASERTIRLQRRSPGGTTWTTIADMNASAATDGMYVKTLTLTATYDWRVLFPDSSEGLESSTSSGLRVTVNPNCQMAYVSEMRIAPEYAIC